MEEKEIELGEVELKNMKIQLQVDELMKENDLEPTFIVVEEPKVYELSSLPQEKNLSGTAALKQNLEDITIIPEYKDGRLQGFSCGIQECP